MTRIILLLLAISATLLAPVHGYFYEPSFGLGLPFKGGMASAQKNQSLVVYGGENATTSYSNDMYELTQSGTGFTWQKIQPQGSLPPPTVYAESVISSDGSSMLVMGGKYQNLNASALQIYQYSFTSNQWSPWSGNNGTNTTTVPVNRYGFSSVYVSSSNSVYIFGGAQSTANSTTLLSDHWVINMGANPVTFTKLPDLGAYRTGHTASLLSNGKIVIIGGIEPASGTAGATLAPFDTINVFDTSSNTWEAPIKANFAGSSQPSVRAYHTAAVTSNDNIIVFGGNNGAAEVDREYINTIGILDTSTWTWTAPDTQGIPPARRSYASGAILDGQHLTVGFGESLNIYYNDVDVLDTTSYTWLQTFSDTSSGSGVSAGMIAGVCIAGAILVAIILFLLYRFQSYLRWLVVRIHSDIWKPRSGEPLWAETTRIIFQVLFLFVFFAFTAFVIQQAVNSPNVSQVIEEPTANVEVPDVRFCFDGFTNNTIQPTVVCQTDSGYPCSSYITPLDMTAFQPVFTDNLGSVECFLFRAPDYFMMTSTVGTNNGSRLLFTFFADQTATSARIHVSAYPSAMDPNTKVYNIQGGTTSLLSDLDIQNWVTNELNDLEATNVYTIEPFTYSAMSYEIVDYQYLQPVGWNYVGFLPILNSTPEISTDFRQESPNPNYASTHSDVGFMAIFPTSYNIETNREVKLYTLVNAVAYVGGILGILVAVQAWLFGYRPRSPWGVVHRWSVGDMKRSLLRGLRTEFKTDSAGIPLVHPVHKRFSMANLQAPIDESDSQRICHVEERMQVLEMLFKAYYVDDEVFRSLDDANKSGLSRRTAPRQDDLEDPKEGGYAPSEKASDHYLLNTL